MPIELAIFDVLQFLGFNVNPRDSPSACLVSVPAMADIRLFGAPKTPVGRAHDGEERSSVGSPFPRELRGAVRLSYKRGNCSEHVGLIFAQNAEELRCAEKKHAF